MGLSPKHGIWPDVNIFRILIMALKIPYEILEKIKKMNPSTSKAFNAMKQKIKKEAKLRETDIEKFKVYQST